MGGDGGGCKEIGGYSKASCQLIGAGSYVQQLGNVGIGPCESVEGMSQAFVVCEVVLPTVVRVKKVAGGLGGQP